LKPGKNSKCPFSLILTLINNSLFELSDRLFAFVPFRIPPVTAEREIWEGIIEFPSHTLKKIL
jgi:hypothetical protein